RQNYGYSWAFGVPGIAMALATFVFWLGTRHYVMMPPTRQTKQAGFLPVFRAAWAGRRTRKPGHSFYDAALGRFSVVVVAAAPAGWRREAEHRLADARLYPVDRG